MIFEIGYVDGNDLHFKVVKIEAENEEKARAKIFEGHGFEHRITHVKEVNE